MKISKTTGHCLGAVRLAAIDVGFDPREEGKKISLPNDHAMLARIAEDGPDDQTGVGFDGPDGRYIVRGTRDEIVAVLAEHGYEIA